MLQCLVQAPFKPPIPPVPVIHISPSSYDNHMREMWIQQAHTDVIFVAGSVGFTAHRFMLASASPLLHRILMTDFSNELNTRSSSESSMVNANVVLNRFFHLHSREIFLVLLLMVMKSLNIIYVMFKGQHLW